MDRESRKIEGAYVNLASSVNIFMVMNPRGLGMAAVRPIAVYPQMTHSTDKKRDNVKPWSQIMSRIIGIPFYFSGSLKMIFPSQPNEQVCYV